MLSQAAREMILEEERIKRERATKRITCAHCGHKETKAEVEERRRRAHINDVPRRFCSQACQKAAWEKEHGAERKRRYRAVKKSPDAVAPRDTIGTVALSPDAVHRADTIVTVERPDGAKRARHYRDNATKGR